MMTITDVLNQASAGHLVFTGICDANRAQSVYNALTPDTCEAVGTLVQVTNPMPDVMEYRFEVYGEDAASDRFDNASIDVLFIGNNSMAKSGSDLVAAWLPKMAAGSYMICFDHYADADAEFTEADTSTTDYPPNWYMRA